MRARFRFLPAAREMKFGAQINNVPRARQNKKRRWCSRPGRAKSLIFLHYLKWCALKRCSATFVATPAPYIYSSRSGKSFAAEYGTERESMARY